MGLGDGITAAAGLWLLNKEQERNRQRELEKQFCGYCGKKTDIKAKCPRCGKLLCKRCSEKCGDCGVIFCPTHFQTHRC